MLEFTSDWINPTEAAVLMGVSVWTLPGWRAKGMGPPFYKYGVRYRYKRREIEDWISRQHSGDR